MMPKNDPQVGEIWTDPPFGHVVVTQRDGEGLWYEYVGRNSQPWPATVDGFCADMRFVRASAAEAVSP